MSLNKALGELFKVIREEAATNAEFALKLEQAMAVYKPSKRAKQAAKAKVAPKPEHRPAPALVITETAPAPPLAPVAPALNPVALLGREGEAALRAELEEGPYSAAALAALAAEHNLDPLGEADGGDKQALVEQIITQAKKRVQRDAKLFDY